ncbi:MAG TPA: hypothetical protein VGL58_14355 [Caulobacteraceae bacterium]|jgi:hypothetical protein
MQSRDFCYWLQGFFELSGDVTTISAEQAAMIRRHLDMVFHHEIEPQRVGLEAPRRRPDAPAPVPDRSPVAPPQPVRDPRPEGPDLPPVVQPPPLC